VYEGVNTRVIAEAMDDEGVLYAIDDQVQLLL